MASPYLKRVGEAALAGVEAGQQFGDWCWVVAELDGGIAGAFQPADGLLGAPRGDEHLGDAGESAVGREVAGQVRHVFIGVPGGFE